MNCISTSLEGVFILEKNILSDERGYFVKTFHEELFRELGLASHWKERYYTSSKAGVIRGMHFQSPPNDHAKLVYVTEGSILDVVLDIRTGSKTYGQYLTIELSEANAKSIYIPGGYAHGFCVLADSAKVDYMTTTVHAPSTDFGILYNSFGLTWPVSEPILSRRDLSFPPFENFKSPF